MKTLPPSTEIDLRDLAIAFNYTITFPSQFSVELKDEKGKLVKQGFSSAAEVRNLQLNSYIRALIDLCNQLNSDTILNFPVKIKAPFIKESDLKDLLR